MERKDKDPCPHLRSFGPTVACPNRSPSSIGDYMVVASGRSQRHFGSVADKVVEDLHKFGVVARVESVPHCHWVLIDASDVIVHVLRPEVRAFDNLEWMWTAGRAARRVS
jgi:ribosome-associated protein